MRLIALFLLSVEGFWTAFRVFYLQSPWPQNLPLHISDFSFFCLVLALCTQKKFFCTLTLLIGVPVAFLAMAFPVISEFGLWRIISALRFYFIHGAIFFGGLYFFWKSIVGYPNGLTFHRTYFITMGYGMALIPINTRLSTNYFFTQYPPQSLPLVLRSLPWDVYFPSACLFFYLLFLAWWWALGRIKISK